MATRYEYTPTKVRISENQKSKIKKAIDEGKPVSIQLSYADLSADSASGEHDILALTQGQINNMAKAYESKKGVRITLSKTQLERNRETRGGFIAALLSSIAAAAAPQLISYLYDKIKGRGLVIKNDNQMIKVKQFGQGLYLRPYNNDKITASGLYLHKGSGEFELDDSGIKPEDLSILNLFKQQ